MTDPAARLRAGALGALGRPLSDDEASSLVNYLNLLRKWQKIHRFVGSSEPEWIVDNVILDSLLYTKALPASVGSICDVGSGAGVPGIPLKIVLPSVDVTLVEARERRASFLATVIRELALRRCRVLSARLQDVAAELEARFDAIVMRCAGPIDEFLAPASRMLRAGGVIVVSGPPAARPVAVGRWLEVDGPRGPRRFWLHQPDYGPPSS